MSRAAGNSSMSPLFEQELDWRAFLYVSGEMSPVDCDEFDRQLERSQVAREAVAHTVQLIEAVTACEPAAGWASVHSSAGSTAIETTIGNSSGRTARDFRLAEGGPANCPRRGSVAKHSHALAILLVTAVSAAGLIAVTHFLPAPKENVARQPPQSVPAELRDEDDFDLPIETVAVFTESTNSGSGGSREFAQRDSSPTTLNVKNGAAQFESVGGADVWVNGPALFGVSSTTGGVLFSGSVSARLTKPDASYSVTSSNLKVVDLGTEFRVTVVDEDLVEIHVLDGEVEIQSCRRLPLFFWDFETSDDGLPDVIAGQRATLEGAARFTGGIVGSRAVAFDNTRGALVHVDGGTGEKVGTGRFACSSGISIEAMIVSRWTAEWEDYDDIFRKSDGLYRMYLSLQNDRSTRDIRGVPRPCLGFYLYLAGLGASKLTLPLDGIAGRPAVGELIDGLPHYVAATYDAFTGRQAIYLDGRLRFERQFPAGSLILSGGPGPAVIGNREAELSQSQSPFNGVIDEVAFYDFALTAEEVAEHYRHVLVGANYYGGAIQQLREAPWSTVSRVAKSQKRLFNRHTGLPVVAAPASQ